MHERLAQAITAQIAQGGYRYGSRLPSHREISREAGVAIGTVTRAVKLLTDRGLIRGEVGRGTFINAGSTGSTAKGVDLTLNIPPLVIDEAIFLNAGERAARKAMALPSAGLYDLKGTADQLSVFASWLSRTRLETSPDELLLCVGAQQAIHLAFEDLRPLSPLIAAESATFSGAIASASHLGMTWLPVEHDEEGMVSAALDRTLAQSGCRILYTIPVCQNPLGFEVGEARRREILKVCEKHDAYIVEDDIYGIYAAKGRLTYKELAPGRVYYLTSLSKCLTPLVRAGVLVPPESRKAPLARALRAYVYGAPPTALEFGAALLDLGADRIAADRLRREARARTKLAAEILSLDGVPMPSGTPHIWLPMKAIEAEKLARRAGDQSIRLTPPDATSIGGDAAGGIRLCILAPDKREDLERALRVVAALLADTEETVV